MNKLTLHLFDYPRELHEYAREFSWWYANSRQGWLPDKAALVWRPLPGLLSDFEPIGGER